LSGRIRVHTYYITLLTPTPQGGGRRGGREGVRKEGERGGEEGRREQSEYPRIGKGRERASSIPLQHLTRHPSVHHNKRIRRT
jgi:hypothetical protein